MIAVFRWLYLLLTDRLYYEWAGRYDMVAYLVSFGQWRRWRESALRYVVGDRVLELGCGPGRLLETMAGQHESIVGVDASPQMAIRAQARQPDDACGASVVQGRAQELPLARDTFDTVVSTFPAKYILDVDTVGKCRRVLDGASDRSSVRRLVIAGLWVDTEVGLLRKCIPVFYSRPGIDAFSVYIFTLVDAGFEPALLETKIGRFRVGTIVALLRG